MEVGNTGTNIDCIIGRVIRKLPVISGDIFIHSSNTQLEN